VQLNFIIEFTDMLAKKTEDMSWTNNNILNDRKNNSREFAQVGVIVYDPITDNYLLSYIVSAFS